MGEVIQFPGNNKEKEEKNPTNIIAMPTSFSELESALDEIGPIHGSQAIYSPDELISIINSVRSGKLNITNVTSTYGLRDKVAALLETDIPPREKIPEEQYDEYYEKRINAPFKEILVDPLLSSLIDSLVRKYVAGPSGVSYGGGLQIFEFEGLVRKADTKEKFIELCQSYLQDSFNVARSVSETDMEGKKLAEYRLEVAQNNLKGGNLQKAVEVIYG